MKIEVCGFMSRLRFFSLVVVAYALVSQPVNAQQYGVNVHATQNPQIIDAALSKAGLSPRVDLHWKNIEPEKGRFIFPSIYDPIDTILSKAVARGLRPLVTLDYGNKFYGGGEDGGDLPISPAAMQAFATYAKFVVKHFKTRIDQFEVYNEWNLNISSTQRPHSWGQAADYVDLLRVVYAAIKEENPNAVVVGGAPGGTDSNWILKFMQSGGLAYLDAFSVHPYVYRHTQQPNPPSWLKVAKAAANESTWVVGTPEEAIAWLDQVKTQVDKFSGGKNIPIYVSEVGWPTNEGPAGVTEAVSAAYLQRFLLMTRARPWIGGVWWYELIDSAADGSKEENRFGLFRFSGDPRPSFNFYLQIRDLLASKTPLSQKSLANSVILVTGDGANADKAGAAWLSTNDFTASRDSPDVIALIRSGYHTAQTESGAKVGAVPILLAK